MDALQIHIMGFLRGPDAMTKRFRMALIIFFSLTSTSFLCLSAILLLNESINEDTTTSYAVINHQEVAETLVSYNTADVGELRIRSLQTLPNEYYNCLNRISSLAEQKGSTLPVVVDTQEVTRHLFLFDEIDGNRVGAISPQTVTVVERHCERWIKISSWLGLKWLDLRFQLPSNIYPIPSGVDRTRPMIALTFDDGPVYYTLRILDTFERYGGNATFFVRGDFVELRPHIVQEAHGRGFEVAGHSWNHPDLRLQSAYQIESQIIRTHNAIEDIVGTIPMIYRPPFGAFNHTVREVSENLGFAIIYWSIDPRDWDVRNSDAIFRSIMSNAYDGGIVLLHDPVSATVTALEQVVPELIERGFQLVTVSQLFYYREIELKPGVVYFSAPIQR